ncbi:MAG TPA: hypothetical protein VHC22_21275 [Pirellulales bacterium]|nr:hypothetical protein [Pirellulales bacterium]
MSTPVATALFMVVAPLTFHRFSPASCVILAVVFGPIKRYRWRIAGSIACRILNGSGVSKASQKADNATVD